MLPEKPWISVLTTETADDAPDVAQLDIALRDCFLHVAERLGKSFIAAAEPNHVHDGKGSAHAYGQGIVENLIKNALPSTGLVPGWEALGDSTAYWNTSSRKVSAESGRRGFFFPGSAGEYLWQRLALHEKNVNLFGAGRGIDMAVSFYGQAAEAPTSGIVQFGIANGGTEAFMGGARCDLSHDDFSSSTWKRFWAPLTLSRGFSTDRRIVTDQDSEDDLLQGSVSASGEPRLLVRVQQDFPGGFYASGFCVHLTRRLLPFHVTTMEGEQAELYGAGVAFSNRVPIWDKAVSMTNAVRITPQ